MRSITFLFFFFLAGCGNPASTIEEADSGVTLPSAEDYVPGTDFHHDLPGIYSDSIGWAVYKSNQAMAKVRYDALHFNSAEIGDRRGQGGLFVTWIYSEEDGTAEQLLESSLEFVMDTYLEPNSSVGLHLHAQTEEIYYLLEGSLIVTVVRSDGSKEAKETLLPGDSHLVRHRQGHTAKAGDQGARIIVIGARPES